MAKVGVRKPSDEYQTIQKRNKTILKKKIPSSHMPIGDAIVGQKSMPVATQAGSTTGKPVKMKSDNPAIDKKVKGYSSEIM